MLENIGWKKYDNKVVNPQEKRVRKLLKHMGNKCTPLNILDVIKLIEELDLLLRMLNTSADLYYETHKSELR